MCVSCCQGCFSIEALYWIGVRMIFKGSHDSSVLTSQFMYFFNVYISNVLSPLVSSLVWFIQSYLKFCKPLTSFVSFLLGR